MNLPAYISKRYFFSKKSHSAINIISFISVVGVAISTMALVVVLSAFNGLKDLVISLYDSFDPDLKITVKEGKTFKALSVPSAEIRKIPGVAYYTEALEEYVILKYHDKQHIAVMKGVSEDFAKMSGVCSMISEGAFKLEENGKPFTVVGQGVYYTLSMSLKDYFRPISIYAPRRGAGNMLSTESAFNLKKIFPSGVFSIQQDFDSKYVLTPISFARELLSYKTETSAIEIGLTKGAKGTQVKEKIQAMLGDKFEIKDRYEQHAILYKIMKSEKWAVFLILTFILIIAMFNAIASVTMLIFDKKKDIAVLRSMGASLPVIRKIFLNEGIFISLLGNVSGMLLGVAICMAQQHFGLIKFKGSFVVDAIPVSMEVNDFIYVFASVSLIGIIAAWFPVRLIAKK